MINRAIASQSTKVGWTSCMNLDDGSYSKHVAGGASDGVFIAYLVKAGDEYTLEHPSARILLKPYEGNFTGKLYWKADKIYGTASDDFKKQVQSIVDKVQGNIPKESDIFSLTDNTYNDTLDRKIVNLTDKQEQEIYADYEKIKNINNPSEKLQLIAVKQNGDAIEYIDNPSEKVQLIAVKEDGGAIQYIKNPSEKVQLEAVKRNANAIQHIKNPSEKVQLEAVKQNGIAIKYIDNPSEKVQLEAVKQNGIAIKYIDNPSEKVQLTIVELNPYIINVIDNSTEKVQLEVVKKDINLIKHIKNPTEKVKKYVEDNS